MRMIECLAVTDTAFL